MSTRVTCADLPRIMQVPSSEPERGSARLARKRTPSDTRTVRGHISNEAGASGHSAAATCLFARLRLGVCRPRPPGKGCVLSLWRPGLQARMTSPAHRFQISRPIRGRRRIAAAAAQLIATAPAKTVSPFTTAGMPEPSSANCSHVTAT